MVELAIEYYKNGLDCGRSILQAALDCGYGVPNDVATISSGISNGLGVGSVCSCLIAGVIVLAAIVGEDEVKRQRIIFLMEFKEAFCSLNCCSISCKREDCVDVITFVCNWLTVANAEKNMLEKRYC